MKQGWKQCLAASIAFAVAAATAAEVSRPGDKPLVVNGDLSLTTLDFDAYMEKVPAARRAEFRAEYEKINPTVDGLWIRRVLAARAHEAGLDKDPLLAARIRLATEDLLAEAFMQDFSSKVKFPNLEPRALEIYKSNPKQFVTPERVSVEHILVSIKQHPREQAEAIAREAHAHAMAGENWDTLARKYSDELGSKEIQGTLVSTFEKPIPETLAKLKEGELAPVVETNFGFHVIRLVSRFPERQQTFQEVKDGLIAGEKTRILDDARTAYVESIRADPKNFLYVENVRGLKSDFKPLEALERQRERAATSAPAAK
jgi:peptidyl-prolyl cis-trans isomerase C